MVLLQQSIAHVSIVYTCNTYSAVHSHVIYSVVSGQYSITMTSMIGLVSYVSMNSQ